MSISKEAFEALLEKRRAEHQHLVTQIQALEQAKQQNIQKAVELQGAIQVLEELLRSFGEDTAGQTGIPAPPPGPPSTHQIGAL